MSSVTVIVPVYNGEPYLHACFDALVKQKYNDFKVLVIDDGSTDGTKNIIHEYEEKYPEMFHSLHKSNGGYGSAIKLGVRSIDTPFFMICDADDLLEPDAVGTLYEKAKKTKADIVIAARKDEITADGSQYYDCCYDHERTKIHKDTVYNRTSDIYGDLFYVDPRSQSKLYRKKVTEGIRYPSGIGYADHILFYLSLLQAKKVVYTEEALAVYRMHSLKGNDAYDNLEGKILAYKQIMLQAAKHTNVPDAFAYRMYLSFKQMFGDVTESDFTKNQKEQLFEYLGALLKKLVPYGKKIAKCGKDEGSLSKRLLRDGLLSRATSSTMYAALVKNACGRKSEEE